MNIKELEKHLDKTYEFYSKGFIGFYANRFGKKQIQYSGDNNNVEYLLNNSNENDKLIIENNSERTDQVRLILEKFDLVVLEEPHYVDEMLAEQPHRFIDKRKGAIKNG